MKACGSSHVNITIIFSNIAESKICININSVVTILWNVWLMGPGPLFTKKTPSYGYRAIPIGKPCDLQMHILQSCSIGNGGNHVITQHQQPRRKWVKSVGICPRTIMVKLEPCNYFLESNIQLIRQRWSFVSFSKSHWQVHSFSIRSQERKR